MTSQFQEYARYVVVQLLGAEEPSTEYLTEIEILNDACAEWLAKYGPVTLLLPRLDGSRIITGNLDRADAAGFCGDDAARAFIAWVDERTGHTATLLMLQVCFAIQRANTEAIEELGKKTGNA
jgi:hypothetical protein